MLALALGCGLPNTFAFLLLPSCCLYRYALRATVNFILNKILSTFAEVPQAIFRCKGSSKYLKGVPAI